jgi:hypothetical protein
MGGEMKFDRTAIQQWSADQYAESLIREHGELQAQQIAEAESERLWTACAETSDAERQGEGWERLNRDYDFAAAVAAGVRAIVRGF